MSTGLQPYGGYRVGDAERGRTADLLKEAHAAGYLTLEEFDERLTVALAARTRAELERLVADLPPDWRARQQGEPPVRRGAAEPFPWFLIPLAFLLVAVIVVGVGTRGFFFPWPLLWVFFFFGHRARSSWYRSHRF
jgi:hypothetical protein